MDIKSTPFRFDPALPVGAVQSYEIASPIVGKRPISCEQAGCRYWAEGWRSRLDVLGNATAVDYIRTASGRRFTEERDGTTVIFAFAPGQTCFQTHYAYEHASEAYLLRPGDWRGTTGNVRVFNGRRRADDWVDHFANHQDRIATLIQRG